MLRIVQDDTIKQRENQSKPKLVTVRAGGEGHIRLCCGGSFLNCCSQRQALDTKAVWIRGVERQFHLILRDTTAENAHEDGSCNGSTEYK